MRICVVNLIGCFFLFPVGVEDFVIGLSQISFFFSYILHTKYYLSRLSYRSYCFSHLLSFIYTLTNDDSEIYAVECSSPTMLKSLYILTREFILKLIAQSIVVQTTPVG